MEAEVDRYVHPFDDPPDVPPAELAALLGGKGANLAIMRSRLGLPVPPGFTISTRACAPAVAGAWPGGLEAEIRSELDRLGELLGRRFGDGKDPLLVSVRSGAPVSMPGMMDTVLNVGLTSAGVEGLAKASGDRAFAEDCRRRLGQGFSDVLATNDVPDDAWGQLRASVDAVFRSWGSERAVAYRRREGIPDDLGTAVTVQAMVFGNRGDDSATGVLFTRDPATGAPEPYGDVMFDAQGEDVVAGGMAPEPIAVLAERLPAVAEELRRHADVLERHFADMCDIEFTVERGRLWLLQVRSGKRSPRAALRIAIDLATDERIRLPREEAVRRVASILADPPRVLVETESRPQALTTGLPASPGLASGEIVTSSADAARVADAGRAVILVRSETSPEDVPGMARSAGILTSRGGLASHAAVVARGWGIPAVVGAEAVRVTDGGVAIGEEQLSVGSTITVDGSSGDVLPGTVVGRWETAPEAETLLAWAREAGITIGADDERAPDVPSESRPGGEDAAPEEILRLVLVKGSGTVDGIAVAAGAADIATTLDGLVNEGLLRTAGDGYGLTPDGKVRALAAYDEDRAALGAERSGTLLEEFHALDLRMKDIVTSWQIREVDGEQVLNDHADAAYDAGVLEALTTLHADTAAWLGGLASALGRYGRYASRLGDALERARSGDDRYVASPRVDSYHGIWFELHEDLIRLAGRSRSDEAAAGRA